MDLLIVAGILVIIIVVLFFYFRRNSNGSNIFSPSLTTLEKYSRDLTKLAKENKLDPVIGRKEEIARGIQLLSRRTKNNPVLIGQASIGKTAIVEGLALAISKREVPDVLRSKRVLSLDLSSILAGTKYRGEFEQRLKKIIDEIIGAKKTIILFIDEIHILSAAGGAEGAINAVDILKPLLSGGELQVVGATTRDEYDEYILKDKTLDRRLQPIYVSEPTLIQTKAILQGIRGVYENYHKVTISDSAISAAISATKEIKNRAYPDKSIDALDEACSKARLDFLKGGKNNKQPSISDRDIKATIAQWQKGENG